jgi:general secretion pathway protein D
MKIILSLIAIFALSACQNYRGENDRMDPVGHIDTPVPPVDSPPLAIPPVVEQVPIIAAPEPAEKLQTFTVVVTKIPVDELLFALARDARLNLDIDPSINGRVSINAVDQTLPQILKRISRQVSLRYHLDGPNFIVERDTPFTRIYKIDYLNIARISSSTVEVASEIASTGSSGSDSSGGGGGSNSSTTVTNQSENNFWETLEENLEQLASSEEYSGSVISNRETGTISVRANSAAHADIQQFVDQVLNSARRQVLIEATVVEVRLNDDFQAGVDWSRIATGDGWSLTQSLLSTTTLGTSPFVSATFIDTNADRTVTAAIKALDSFGEVSVMSSPKIMALNNQTSILKVVDNIVYFSIETDQNISEGGSVNTTFDVTIHTVPVGFVMNVTPFITENDEVILNIRPTISRIIRFVPTPVRLDPLTSEPLSTPNQIPEIAVREMESVLRVANGHTAVIGGLMQDVAGETSEGLPGLHDARGIGVLFGVKTQQLEKTELVIFLRPRIIENASLDTNLSDFKRFLKPTIFSK